VTKSFREVYLLKKKLQFLFPNKTFYFPPKANWCCVDHKALAFIKHRARDLTCFMQEVVDSLDLWECKAVRQFFNVSEASFNPTLGEKGIEGWLLKDSGGYNSGFSRQWGDFISIKQWRWFKFNKEQITW